APALRADDACRHRLSEGKGIAESKHPITDLDVVRLRDPDGRQTLRIDLQYRDVGVGIAPDYLGLELPTVGERDPDRLRIFHDVVVGQDVAVLTDDEAGAAASLYAWGGHRLALEEILEGKALERNRLAH